jgi:bifunctional DNase/RNase
VEGPPQGPERPSEAGHEHDERHDGQIDGQQRHEAPAAEVEEGIEGAAESEPLEGTPDRAEADGLSPAAEAAVEPAPMRQVAFMEVVLELPNTNPAVVLHEIDPPRRALRVTIAQPEGVAIAYAWRGMATPRPLTHDLLTTILHRFGLQVDAVRIVGVDGPVFHAELALSGPSGSHTVECRPSDALALALRQPLPVPIMVAEEVLATAGYFLA